jgi:hypothetical protein
MVAHTPDAPALETRRRGSGPHSGRTRTRNAKAGKRPALRTRPHSKREGGEAARTPDAPVLETRRRGADSRRPPASMW